MPHGEEFSNTILVTVDGTPLPDDIKPLLVNGYVDDSTNVPDMFVLRFSDDGGTVLAKARFKIGAKVELSLQSTAPGGPHRAPQGRGDRAGGGGGRDRASTRWCGAWTRRTGCSAAPGSRPTST